jgi:hypothetical protein
LLATDTKRRVIMITSRQRRLDLPQRAASLTAEPAPVLIRQLLGDLATLCRQELALAKADLSDSLAAAGKSATLIALGGAALFGGFLVLLSAAILALGTVIAMWLASLAVGVGVLLAGCLLLKIGVARARAARRPALQSTDSLRRDKDVLSRSTS